MNVIEYKSYTRTVEFSAKNNILYGKITGINSLVIFATSHNMTLNATIEQALQKFVSNH